MTTDEIIAWDDRKCVVCDESICHLPKSWGFRIKPNTWIHYRCLESLWETYSLIKKQINVEDVIE